jgi:glycosyltransferase involved in cell wall biosynthesis
MRIVHTESSLGWGGQEIRVLAEAAGFAARGHDMVVIAPRESRIFQEATKRSIAVEALPIGRKNLVGFRRLRAWLMAHPVDIVNTHSSTDSWLAALACASIRGAPAIVRTRHVSAPVPANLPTRWLYTRAARAIVTTGESLKEQLVRVNHFPASNIFSVPTGIDSTRFVPGDRVSARRALGLPADALIVGIVATLRSWKGHRFLVDAIARLATLASSRRTDVLLVIVGDGPQRAALEGRIAERGIADRVRMVGNQDDVLPWLQAFDLFALPSYANEGVPQALLQASLCALPIVTTAIGAIPEIAIDGETALVVAPQNVDALALAIEQLAQAPSLRATLGAKARERAQARFGYDAMLDRMESIFRGVLEPVRATRSES